MKRTLFLLLLAFAFVGVVNAQEVYYKCIANNVSVRKAPSVKSPRVQFTGAYGSSGPVALDKDEIVSGTGKVQGGFTQVNYVGTYNLWYSGWVSTQYLKRIYKCKVCKGKGFFDEICPNCDGIGVHACCDYTGKKRCDNCYGIGYK